MKNKIISICFSIIINFLALILFSHSIAYAQTSIHTKTTHQIKFLTHQTITTLPTVYVTP